MVIFRLATSGMLPVLFSILFYYGEKNTAFGKLSYKARQWIIGISFGVLAILSTEFGIDVGGAALNVRDAAPLTAGLLFGGPAGVIAGVVGGVERWMAAYWGVGEYTRLACSLGTFLAGITGAAVRRYLLDDKRASWAYGLATGITVEVMHMLMVFLTKMSDVHRAFEIVQICAFKMILANGLSVMMSAWCVGMMGRRKKEKSAEIKKIAQTFQRWLLVCVFIAFIATCAFTYVIQNRMAFANTDELLEINMFDVRNDIMDASDENLLELSREIKKALPDQADNEVLLSLAKQFDVAEINLVDDHGIIRYSTYPEFVGFDMASGEQSAEFLVLLKGKTELVQDYQPTTFDPAISRKYGAVALENGGFLQVGYDAWRFQSDIDDLAVNAAKNRHIGQNGCVIICNENWIIASDREGYRGKKLEEVGISIDTEATDPNTRFVSTVYGVRSYCMYTESEGYCIISVLPAEEAMFGRKTSVHILFFMEILVFSTLFAYIYFLVKKVVVENIQKVNTTLGQITGGNLDVVVDVRSNEEFASLSDDINATVTTLKHYIAEAAARIDQELEFARNIQYSSLPTVTQAYADRKDFDIYALMDTAKEVGGDFYDFYFINDHQLAFLVADVSGKGIPAAMFMMTAKTLMEDLAGSGLDTAEIFTAANKRLCDGNDANMFVTAWMGILNLWTGHLTYSNAGHNPPLVKRADGTFEYLRTRPNLVLAAMDGVRYKKHELWLRPGDMICLYTDGMTEAQNQDGELYGEERLLHSLNRAEESDVQEICKKVKEDVDLYMGEADQFDDITMLMVKFNRMENSSVLEVEPDRDSLAAVNDFMEKTLDKLEVPVKTAAKLKIAVDEIYSNIVFYSNATKAEVMCFMENEKLFVVFEDNGTPYNPLEAAKPDVTLSAEDREIGGLGILVVRKLMDEISYEYADGLNRLTLVKENLQL